MSIRTQAPAAIPRRAAAGGRSTSGAVVSAFLGLVMLAPGVLQKRADGILISPAMSQVQIYCLLPRRTDFGWPTDAPTLLWLNARNA